jgi:serine/threonine protein kinase
VSNAPDAPTGPLQREDERTRLEAPMNDSAGGSLNAGSALPRGHAVQEYVIEGLVGEGGFGIVYLARDTRLGRNVALKEYMPGNLAMRGADHTVSVRSERHRETFELGLRSFVNEAQLLASFDHPSLVKVYRFWEENGTAYMVMPFYEGTTLKKWLSELGHPPDERWLLALLAPMIDALEQLHHDHCYHRDIAPDNILLLPHQGTQAGGAAATVRPLLLDFGAARRVIGDMTHALTVILKPGYAPIEQYADSVAMKQGPWTDVYALSAVLYNCVTGRAPVPSVSRIMTDDMVPAASAGESRYSPMFLEAIDAGLAVRPDARPQSMAALRELFAATSHGDMGLAATAVPAAPARPPQQAPAPAGKAPAPPPKAGRIEPVMALPDTDQQTVIAPRAGGEAAPAAPAMTASKQAAAAPSARARTPSSSAPAGKLPLILSLAALVLLAGGGGWWWLGAGGGKPPPGVAAKPAAPSGENASPAVAAAPAAAGQAPAPAPATAAATTAAATDPTPFSVVAALQDIVERSDPQQAVSTLPDKSTVTIGKDLLRFRVKSSESGFLYIFFGGTEKTHFQLLFPNQLDGKNRIEAGREVVLPRKEWEIVASGPAGTNHIVAVVSRRERDLSSAGLVRSADAIPEFDLALAAQRWAQRQPGTPSPFVGKARCDAAPCDESYGAKLMQILEVDAPAKAPR